MPVFLTHPTPDSRSAVACHGLPLSTSPEAARLYRSAQRNCRDRHQLLEVLGQAALSDPNFAVALHDLAALGQRTLPPCSAAGLHAWERHHIQIVTAAANGDAKHAQDLLCEHLKMVGCDPVASAVVAAATGESPSGGRC